MTLFLIMLGALILVFCAHATLPTSAPRRLLYAMLAAVVLMLAAFSHASARDLGQWGEQPPAVAQWFKGLMQPDNPLVPCCGEADAYWADSFEIKGNQYVAIVTDERADVPLGRPHIDPGTRVEIPNGKIKFDRGNPTGHGILFISASGTVYCYLPPGGV